MSELSTLISNLRRPGLLIRAARFGLEDYRRDRDLRRLIGSVAPPENALRRLLDVEEDLEIIRVKGDAAYSVVRHIDVLIALLSEARLLPRATRSI